MSRLITIQKRNNLNEIYRADAPGVGGASHHYKVVKSGAAINQKGDTLDEHDIVAEIVFQHGLRKDEGSIHGVLDVDLLEIVRDRLKAFNQGEFATRENALAITHIEEALLWLNKRVEDRAERGVLGTTNK